MGFLDSLFSGVKVFVKEFFSAVGEAVRVVLSEIDNSSFGKATTQLIRGATRKYFNDAADLAEEERDLALKYQRDGRRSEVDAERLREISAERSKLKQNLDLARVQDAANELREEKESIVSAPVDDDEASAAVGILASKTCPECGETMRIRQGGYNDRTERRHFFWQCTSTKLACPTIRLDPQAGAAHVMRKPDPNLDLSLSKRREIWQRKDILVETATRIRQGLGDEDEEIVCPAHLLPMKLLPKAQADGRLLTSYEYVCLGVDSDGRACNHKVALETFPQVSEALRRREGVGIIRG
jgi:hypothetical protein